jgi:phosphoribosylpyrophosphate synthetase
MSRNSSYNSYNSDKSVLLLSTKNSQFLIHPLHDKLLTQYEEVNIQHFLSEQFQDGEIHLMLPRQVESKHIVVISSPTTETEIFELFGILTVLLKKDINSIRLIIPFFRYCTQEREAKEGEVPMGLVYASALNNIFNYNRNIRCYIDLYGLHSETIIPSFHNLTVTHNLPLNKIANVVKNIVDSNSNQLKIVIGGTDAGRLKDIQEIARILYNTYKISVSIMYLNKIRLPQGGTKILSEANGSVFLKPEDVPEETYSETESETESSTMQKMLFILYDDIINSGGSFLKALIHFHNKYPIEKSYGIAIHGILSGTAVDDIIKSSLSEMHFSDSHPNAVKASTENHKIKIFSCLDA